MQVEITPSQIVGGWTPGWKPTGGWAGPWCLLRLNGVPTWVRAARGPSGQPGPFWFAGPPVIGRRTAA